MNSLSLLLFANHTFLSLIFFAKNKKLVEVKEKINFDFTEVFFEKLKLISQKKGFSLEQIHQIYAGIGPGSFIIHRVIVTFLKTMQILNSNLQLFVINSLTFQAGLKKKVISLLTANKKSFYLQVVANGKILPSPQSVLKSDLPNFVEKYSQFVIYQDFNGFDCWIHFQDMIDHFLLVTDWTKLQPIEF